MRSFFIKFAISYVKYVITRGATFTRCQTVTIFSCKGLNLAKIKHMSFSGNILKKFRVGRSEKYSILFFHFILKLCKM